MTDIDVAALRSIGFNTHEVRGSRELHIQTEIMVRRGQVVAKTMLTEQGTVLDVIVCALPAASGHDFDTTAQFAESQHSSVIADVRRGRYDAS